MFLYDFISTCDSCSGNPQVRWLSWGLSTPINPNHWGLRGAWDIRLSWVDSCGGMYGMYVYMHTMSYHVIDVHTLNFKCTYIYIFIGSRFRSRCVDALTARPKAPVRGRAWIPRIGRRRQVFFLRGVILEKQLKYGFNCKNDYDIWDIIEYIYVYNIIIYIHTYIYMYIGNIW
jgi:hypothetical protein